MALVAAKQEAEQAAEASRLAMLEAQAADHAKTEFLANMSHELRTPLNAIIGFSDIIRNGMLGDDSTSKSMEYARYIYDSGNHLLDLINDILDLAKIEAGKLVLHEQVTDVGEIVDTCLMIIKDRADSGGLELRRRLSEPLPALNADGRKLRQILINLMSNAVKFTPDGGSISVEASSAPGSGLTIFVVDTGIGISRDNLAKVMAPFWQVEGSFSRTYQGTGLGLPLTKALVEAHGGTLTIESEPGSGTRVSVEFPADRVRWDELPICKPNAADKAVVGRDTGCAPPIVG